MKQLRRREFLKVAGSAAALSTTLQASEGRKIRTGVWGTQHGHVRGKLKTLLDSSDYEVVAVCEPDAAARRAAQDNPLFAGLRWVSEEELLGDPGIELVVVECWIWEAIPRGQRVIAAGKHLHLEKPAGGDMEGFRQLVEQARRKGLLLQMGYVWRFHEGLNAAFEAARQGWLGDVYMLRGTINKDLGPERRADWARYAGGTMFELGGHVIDRMVAFWGRPNRVQTWLRTDTLQDNLADNTMAVLEYDQGLAVAYSCAVMAGSSQHRSFEVIGTDGSFVIQPVEPGTRMQVVMREARGPYRAGWQEVSLPPQDRYIGDFQDLARALKQNQPLTHGYEHELILQETLLKASGQFQAVEPAE